MRMEASYVMKLTELEIPNWVWTFIAIGFMSTVRLGFRLFDSIRFHTATPSHPLSSYKRPGSRPTYALVTGGSAGIGYGIAEELVRNGFGVILLGHLADEVEASAARLRALAGNDSVSTIILDAKVATPEEIGAAIENTITNKELQLSILVNNVGSNPVAHPPFRPLASYSAHDIDAVIDLNSRFMARLTAVVLPILSKRDHQDKTSDEAESQRSLILNIASGGMYGSPWLVIYGATKAFNWAFSNSLAMELEAQRETQNVHCLCVVPGDMKSQGNSLWVTKGSPDSSTFGRLIVNRVDGAIARGWREMRPYWLHDLQCYLLRVIPESQKTKALIDVMGKKREAFNSVYRKAE